MCVCVCVCLCLCSILSHVALFVIFDTEHFKNPTLLENHPIPYSKYVIILLLVRRHEKNRESLSAMFNSCDETGSGFISVGAIHNLLGMLGYQITVQEVADMVRAFDVNKRGKLDKDGK